MKRSHRCKCGVGVLGGLCLAVLLCGPTAPAAAATDEGNGPAASTRAIPPRPRHTSTTAAPRLIFRVNPIIIVSSTHGPCRCFKKVSFARKSSARVTANIPRAHAGSTFRQAARR